MKTLKLLAVAVCAIALTACNTLQKPQSVSEQLDYALATVTTVRQSADQALTAHLIPVTVAEKILADTDAARSAIDTGKAAFAVHDSATAETALETATTLIGALQAYLISQGVK